MKRLPKPKPCQHVALDRGKSDWSEPLASQKKQQKKSTLPVTHPDVFFQVVANSLVICGSIFPGTEAKLTGL